MAVYNAETRRFNLRQLLYSIKNGSGIIARRIEKSNKKLVLNSSGVLFNQVCIGERLLIKHTNIYIRYK